MKLVCRSNHWHTPPLKTPAGGLYWLQFKRNAMWEEIQDMPGEIFDITDETRDEMAAAWADDVEDEPGWDLWGWDE